MEVNVLNSEIIRKSGHGQYLIVIEMQIDNNIEVTKSFHTTDSQLFDDSKDDDFDSERLINTVGGLKAIIESFEYHIVNRENGDFIDSFYTLEEAEKELSIYECMDKENGEFDKNFYQIKIK